MKMQNDKLKFKEEFKGRVYEFALDIITFVERLPRRQVASVISDQLLRSATSIGANVVEAQGAGSKKDYTNFSSYALKSVNENKFWLGLLRDSGKAEREVTELANILAASILTLKGKK